MSEGRYCVECGEGLLCEVWYDPVGELAVYACDWCGFMADVDFPLQVGSEFVQLAS